MTSVMRVVVVVIRGTSRGGMRVVGRRGMVGVLETKKENKTIRISQTFLFDYFPTDYVAVVNTLIDYNFTSKTHRLCLSRRK